MYELLLSAGIRGSLIGASALSVFSVLVRARAGTGQRFVYSVDGLRSAVDGGWLVVKVKKLCAVLTRNS